MSGELWLATTLGLGKGGIFSKTVARPFVPGWKISSRVASSCSGRATLGGTLLHPNTAMCQFLPQLGAELWKVPAVEKKKEHNPDNGEEEPLQRFPGGGPVTRQPCLGLGLVLQPWGAAFSQLPLTRAR